MTLPSLQALSLHQEVCQEHTQPENGQLPENGLFTEAEEEDRLEGVEEISIKEEAIGSIGEDAEPPRKKTKKPLPALIPI